MSDQYPPKYLEHRKHCANCLGTDLTNEPYARCAEGRKFMASGFISVVDTRTVPPALLELMEDLQRLTTKLFTQTGQTCIHSVLVSHDYGFRLGMIPGGHTILQLDCGEVIVSVLK